MQHTVLLALGAVLPVLCDPATSQDVIRRHEISSPDAVFGFACAAVGDVDQDGVGDYAIGAPRGSTDSEGSGSVRVYSGRTGKVLWSFRGENAGDRFGYAIAGPGDVDGDGAADVAVGAPFDPDRRRLQSGSVQVFSGIDGRILWTVRGTSAGNGLGWSLCVPGDVDRDGHPDLAAGAPFRDVAPRRHDAGAVRILSGATGETLRLLTGTRPAARYGWALDATGDLDHDGRRDLLVGIEGHADRSGVAGHAGIWSSRSGRRILEVEGRPGDYFGTAVATVGDVDGDGREDFLVGARNASRGGEDGEPTGVAMLFSGRRGTRLHTFAGDHAHDWFGHALAAVGDVDGDGTTDVAVGAPQTAVNGTGYVRVFSGRSGREILTLRGERPGDGFGAALCAVEIPGKERRKERAILIGAPWNGGKGVALVVRLHAPAPEDEKKEGGGR